MKKKEEEVRGWEPREYRQAIESDFKRSLEMIQIKATYMLQDIKHYGPTSVAYAGAWSGRVSRDVDEIMRYALEVMGHAQSLSHFVLLKDCRLEDAEKKKK